MAELHDALKYLGPAEWSSIPTEGPDLENYIADLLCHSQLIVDSVPLPSPDDAPIPPQAQLHGRAKKASEVTLSSERSAQPSFGHDKFWKEWGKPMKIKTQENPLGLSVYKMSGKEGRGSWFARHSIHEGIGFSKFKKSLQMEFEKSLAEQGPPGTGNVRGIGGEERVEQIKTEKALVEVYRLSAQFPGPTAARDFVTMLVTSDNALQVENAGKQGQEPRHYMIISRPCDHPKTQPRNGFVRGYYESVEFIREVPRKLKESQSSTELNTQGHQRTHTFPIESSSGSHHGRHRSATADQAEVKSSLENTNLSDAEENPVEWLMITRSDPGGGIPRFLVERGTPSSICSDAVKFLDWACQNDEEEVAIDEATSKLPQPERRQSHQSWVSRSLVGVTESEQDELPGQENIEAAKATEPRDVETVQTTSPGLLGTVTGAAASLRPYTPQVILNHLPAGAVSQHTNGDHSRSGEPLNTQSPTDLQEDSHSIKSTTSFASAEDHWSSEPEEEAEERSIDSRHSPDAMTDSKEHLQREKELRRLDDRKHALHKKFAETQTKFDEAKAKQVDADAQQSAKASEKHERELKKHEEKYQKELAKIERKQEKERKRIADKIKKQAEKNEINRLTLERDEARKELDLVKREAESLRLIVQDLQSQNTNLVIKLGRAGLSSEKELGSRSRGSSISRKEDKKTKDRDLAVASAAASMKSAETAQGTHHA